MNNTQVQQRFDRYFTPFEANQRLPLVKTIVDEILVKGKKLKDCIAEQEEQDWPKELFDLEKEVENLIGELEELGCYFKDWDFKFGIVDFPSRIDGEEVFLCWKSDEEELGWYHPIDEGFQSRKPIPEHLLV